MNWNKLRAVLFIQRLRPDSIGTYTQVVKIGLDWPLNQSATREVSDKQYTPVECDDIGRQLEARSFVQRGCFVGDEQAWAMAWLKPGDEPELLSEAMGEPIVPSTLMWHFSTGNMPGHIYSSLSADHIRRARVRNSSESGDLSVRELPTLEQRLKAHGLTK